MWGPYDTPTFDGNKFFLTIVDDISKIVWVFLLKLKSDVLVILKHFVSMIDTQFNAMLKDSGLIMEKNSSILLCRICSKVWKLFTIGLVSIPLNRMALLKGNTDLLEVARALRFQGHIPIKL